MAKEIILYNLRDDVTDEDYKSGMRNTRVRYC